MPTTTTTRYELRTQDGTPMAAQWDLIPGKAHLDETQNVTPNDQGEYDHEWQGGTEMYYDAQEPERHYGEDLYTDHAGNNYLAGDLVVAEITEDDEGNEKVTTRPFTQGIQPPLPPRPTPADRAVRALELAQWIAGSDREVELNTLHAEARDRVHARAREYAQAEGVADLLDAILAALHAA